MNKARNLQEVQEQSLDNSINTINNIQDVGHEILNDIDRHTQVLGEVQNNLVDTNSKLNKEIYINKYPVNRIVN